LVAVQSPQAAQLRLSFGNLSAGQRKLCLKALQHFHPLFRHILGFQQRGLQLLLALFPLTALLSVGQA
jgi:hypothetical protein